MCAQSVEYEQDGTQFIVITRFSTSRHVVMSCSIELQIGHKKIHMINKTVCPRDYWGNTMHNILITM